MKIFNILQVSVDLSTKFVIISLASGGSAHEPPPSPYFQNFLNFSLHFHVNFDRIFKILQKIAKFPLKFLKNYSFFIDFEQNL